MSDEKLCAACLSFSPSSYFNNPKWRICDYCDTIKSQKVVNIEHYRVVKILKRSK